jgi:phage shock protein E
MEILKNFWLPALVGLWFLYKWRTAKKIIHLLPQLKEQGASFIDVRSQSEFASGNAPNTINIPLHELKSRLNEITKTAPVVVCCASGTRSGMAKVILKKNGFNKVYNIGTWTNFLRS